MFPAGRRIKEIRKENKLLQAKLAEGIISRTYLSQIEQGTVQPSMKILREIAKKLDCSVEDFFTDIEKNQVVTINNYKLLSSLEYSIANKEYEGVEENLKDIEKRLKEFNSKELGLFYYCKAKFLKDFYKDADASIELFLQSVEKYSQPALYLERIRSTNELVTIFIEQNNLSKAFELLDISYNEALFFRLSGLEKIKLLLNLGIAHGKKGEYYSSIRFLNSVIDISIKTNIYYRSGETYMVLGLCHKGRKEYEEALIAYNKAASHFEILDDKLNLAGTILNIGIVHRLTGQNQKSIDFFKKSLALYEELNDYFGKLNTFFELALSYHMNRNEQEVTSLFESFISLYRESRFPTSIYLKFLVLMGDCALDNRNFSEALELYKKAFSNKHCSIEQKKEINFHVSKLFSKYFDSKEIKEWYKEIAKIT